jgi:hypothetical protein
MKTTAGNIAKHLGIIVGTTALLVFVMLRPFLAGRYDGLSVPLSTMVQVCGVVGLLLVPIGIAWLAYELRSERKEKRHRFAVASLAAGVVVALAVSLVGVATSGISLGVLTFGIGLYLAVQCVRALKEEENSERNALSAIPLYLVSLPVLILVLQLVLAEPVIEWSRSRAIAQSTEFINAIEQYRAANGTYPASLGATWADYDTGVIGIERHTYARGVEAYNIIFQLPSFLLNDFGTREFVVYNPRDEHTITSHTNWILLATPEESLEGRGWYASHDAGALHWKSFLFD